MQPFPQDVTRFINEYIETIDQLEILRILSGDRRREWDPQTLAGEVQAQPQTILHHLKAMQGRGLLTNDQRADGLVCRYGVSTPELEGTVNRVLQSYEQRPVTMIKFVYERARDPLRSFIDAFRLRKKD